MRDTRKLAVRVQQDHIERGVKANPRLHPVALALLDAGLREAEIDSVGFWYKRDDGFSWASGEVPPSVVKFLKEFDAGRPVAPFQFEIFVEV